MRVERILIVASFCVLVNACSPAPSSTANAPRASTPLHAAAASGDLGAVERLLAEGVEPNALDLSGRTPLHLAAANGHGQTTETLVRGGADPNLPDDGGATAFDLARAGGHESTAATLLSVTRPTASAAQPRARSGGLNPSLKYPDAESFGRAIGGPAVMVRGKHVHVFAATEFEKSARIVQPILERAYDELLAIVGMSPPYDLVVYHFPQGHPEAFGGTSNGTIWYDDQNLRFEEHDEWRKYGVPHVSGYIEEMAHNFVSSTHVQFGWEMVGWSLGAAVTSKAAPNPLFESAVASTRATQAETYRRYVAGGYVFPADIESNLVDRIHAHLLWQEEQQYGAKFWPDFFAQVRKTQSEFEEAAAIGDTNANRNARYQLSVRCFDQLRGLDFSQMLSRNQISLTTDIKALNPESPSWDRRLR